MKPADDPEFFRLPPPPGRSRESTIRLDAEGHFFHDGERVTHAKLAEAMHSWIGRHPDNGRYVLNNGHDWTYFTVEDAPYVVRGIRAEDGNPVLLLSDGTTEPLDPRTLRAGPEGSYYTRVKRTAPGGPFDAKLGRHAQTDLAPFLVEVGGHLAVQVGGESIRIGDSQRAER